MLKKWLVLVLTLLIIIPLAAIPVFAETQILFYCYHQETFPDQTSIDGYAFCELGYYGDWKCQGFAFTSHYSYMVTADLGWDGRWYVGSGTDHFQCAQTPIGYIWNPDAVYYYEPECYHNVF